MWKTHCQVLYGDDIRPGPHNTASAGDPNQLERLLGATEPVFGVLSLFLGGEIHFLTGMSYQ